MNIRIMDACPSQAPALTWKQQNAHLSLTPTSPSELVEVSPANRCESTVRHLNKTKDRVNRLLGVPALGLMEPFGIETSLEVYLRVNF